MLSEKKAAPYFAKDRQLSLLNNITRLFNNPEYSDVTVKIIDFILPAHQFVIFTQCEYLKKAALRRPFGAGATSIELTDGSGMAYWRVFEYLYTGDYYDEYLSLTWIEDPSLLKDVRVYAIADQFVLEGLKALAVTKFQQKLLACQLDTAFTTCVREVYQTSHRPESKLRAAVVSRAVGLATESLLDYIKIFDDVPGFIRTSDELGAFRSLLREGGCFVDDYCMALNVRIATGKP